MKKVCLWGALILVAGALCLTAWYFTAGNDMERYLEKELRISLPDGMEIARLDSHGGFHGDGTLLAVLTVPDKAEQEALWERVEDTWSALPADDAIMEPIRQLWEERCGALPLLPDTEDGRWFYRDRYEEQYGEKCEFNSVLQNCTFALLDKDSGQLYVLKNDC